MKKQNNIKAAEELREEYDISKMPGVVRGKYAREYKKGTNVITLAPDVAKAFKSEKEVNEALRMLMSIAKSSSRRAS